MAISGAEAQRRYRQRWPDRVREQGRRQDRRRDKEGNLSRRVHRFVCGSNKRARQQGIGGVLRAQDAAQITGPCHYCSGVAMGWDHVVPLASGGFNSVENLVPSCHSCNLARPRPWQRKVAV